MQAADEGCDAWKEEVVDDGGAPEEEAEEGGEGEEVEGDGSDEDDRDGKAFRGVGCAVFVRPIEIAIELAKRGCRRGGGAPVEAL